MNRKIPILIILFDIFFIYCQNNDKIEIPQEELKSCEKEPNTIENTFILKTNLSENEIEELLSKEFSSNYNNKEKDKIEKGMKLILSNLNLKII